MIYDLLDVFRSKYEIDGDKLILDNYELKDGLYVKVNADSSFEYFIFLNDKKEKNKENCFKDMDGNIQQKKYSWFAERDYYSSIINDDTNKSITSARYAKILSTNYLSFFFRFSVIFEKINNQLYKKEEINDNIFLSLDSKQKKTLKKRMEKRLITFDELWEIAEKHYYPKLKSTMKGSIENNYKHIIKGIIDFIQSKGIEIDYVKIFFDESLDEYKRAQELYWKERIFNKNDFNIEIESEIFGLSNSNISFSVDKPFNEHKTTKFRVPFRISHINAIYIKIFFDWLENQDIYDKSIFKRNFLYVNRYMANKKDLSYKKEIKDFDYLPVKIEELNDEIVVKNHLHIKDKEDIRLTELWQLEAIVDEVFYNKQLKNNYFRDDLKVSDFVSKNLQQLIFETKYAMVNYFKKYNEKEFYQVIKKYGTDFVIEHLRQNRDYKAKESLNLKFSLLKYKGETVMDIMEVQKRVITKLETSDYSDLSSEEFFYLCGQVIKYLLTKSKSGKKDADMLEPFLRAKSIKKLKDEIKFTFFKYKHEIGLNQTKFNNALSLITAYEKDDVFNSDSFLVGVLSQNLFYMKKEEN